MNLFRLTIPRPIFDAILEHAQAERPAECCGFLAGNVVDGEGRVTLRLPLVNSLRSPTRYAADPHSLVMAHKAMRTAGTEILAIYHSHPTTDPIPSRFDREENFYGQHVMHLIVGLRGEVPDMRGWWLTADSAHVAEWVVECSRAV